MVMTAIMLTVLLGFTALSIDIGLHHYLGAKLQNAADSAALAAGTMLDADESERYKTVYDYLAKNGYDNSNGDYKDKINVQIDYKGVAPELASTSTYEYDEYISKGYMRVTVDVDDSTLFGNALGIKSLHLQKVAYVLIQPNYEGMPEALKYSIFAGARWGDLDSSADNSGETKYYIDARNPAMDIQGSTGAGSGETAFTTVVAVAESTINGVNNFVQNLKGWMNSTFGTSFSQDYNKLVNINVSEAVMNNDAHSNSNILIGVQALNTSRTKDNDYTGNSPTGDTTSNYTENTTDSYNGRTDADDYGAVHFSAVEGRNSSNAQKYGIKFGYSRYAEERAAAATAAANANNIFDAAGNLISYTVYNYLNNNPELTRVYVQNMQNVQAVQHAINILNEMDLDDYSSADFTSPYVNDGAGAFEIAAKNYFKANSKVSTQIQSKVLDMETDLVFNSASRTITLNNQESIVYRVNQKVADGYLTDYANLEVDLTSPEEEQRKSRLEQLTSELQTVGYDKLYANSNNPSSGLLYAGYADTDGGTIQEGAYEDIKLERYENSAGDHVEKSDEGAQLKYTYTLNVNGKKANRNMDNVETYASRYDISDIKATRVGAKYAVTRTFKEKSDYIDMPNLRPFFVRQINQSVRDATKKRGQFNDGVTTGDRSVKDAVKTAQNGLDEVMDEVAYTDTTYQDADKYDKDYASSLLFTDYKNSESSGITNLGSTAQTLGGVQMSNHSYKGYELYKDDGTLKKAIDFVNEYDTHNKNNSWFGYNAVNYYATHDAVNDYNAVSKKKTQINNTFSSSVGNNSSYASKKSWVAGVINDLTKPVIPDISGNTEEEQQAQDADREVEIATPTNPLATRPNQIFLGDNGAGRNGLVVGGDTGSKRAYFNTVFAENQTIAPPDAFTAVGSTDAPNNVDSGYTAGATAFPDDYSTLTSIPAAPSSPNVATIPEWYEMAAQYGGSWGWASDKDTANGNEIKGNKWGGRDNPVELVDHTIYSCINNPGKDWHWLSVKTPVNGMVFFHNSGTNISLTKDGKSLNLQHGSSLFTKGSISITSGSGCVINFGDSTNGGANLYADGDIYIENKDSNENVYANSKVYSRGKFQTNKKLYIYSGSEIKSNTFVKSGDYLEANACTINAGTDIDSDGNSSYMGTDSSHKTTATAVGYIKASGRIYASNANLHAGKYIYSNGDTTFENNSNVVISGTEKTTQKIDDVNYDLGLHITGHLTVKGSSTLKINGDFGSTSGDKDVTVGTDSTTNDSSVMVVNGNLKIRRHLYVNKGAKLYVTGDIITYNSITNYGTIVCGGTISTKTGTISNYGNMYSNNITVKNGDSNRGLFTNCDGATLVVKGTLDCWRLKNGGNADAKKGKAKATIGTQLTVHSNGNDAIIENNPANYVEGDDASTRASEIHINGSLYNTNGGTINNNYANNSSGSVAKLYISQITYIAGNPTTLVNYEKSEFYGSTNALSFSTITNHNNSTVKTNGNLTVTTITNNGNGVVYAKGNITVSSACTNNNTSKTWCGGNLVLNNASFTCNVGTSVGGSITKDSGQGGTITCVGLIAKDSISAKSLNTTGVVRTNGNISISGDLTIGSSASVTTTNGSVSAANITNNNSLLVNGDITAGTKLINKKYVLCTGDVETTSGDLENGENTEAGRASHLHCFGNMTVGRHLDNYGIIYVGAYSGGSPVANTGAITVNGDNNSGNGDSISCFGSIYAVGDINTNYKNYISGATIYTLGDFKACNSGGTMLMYIIGRSNIFIRGMLTSDNSNENAQMQITLDSGDGNWGSVLSVLGVTAASNKDCFNNRLYFLNNKQQGSNIYLGTNLLLKGTGSYTDESTRSDVLKNSGRLYVNGSISAPNALSMHLDGDSDSYDYDLNISVTDSDGYNYTYSYKGMTYCKDMFSAPNATVIMGSYHLLYVNDAYDEDATPGKDNIIVKKLILNGHSVVFSPNKADIDNGLILRDQAIVNIRKKTSVTPEYSDSYSGTVYAPVTVDLTGAPLTNISTNVVFNTDKTASSLRGTRVRIKVIGNLTINGAINLNNSVLIVTGNLICNSLTMVNSNLWVQGAMRVNGAIDVSSESLVRIDNNITNATSITIDNSTVFVSEGIANATSLSVDHLGQLFVRDNDVSVHNDDVVLSSTTTVNGGGKVYVDGILTTSQLTVNDESQVFGYAGIQFTGNNTINIDQTTHGSNNSFVFCGDSTNDNVLYNFQIDGTIYLPGGKTFDNSSNGEYHVHVHNHGIMVCDSPITSTWVEVGDSAVANDNATLYCAGRITLKGNATYTNYGKLYAMGGTDIGGARKATGDNDYDFNLLKDGCETYFGEIYSNGTKQTTYTTRGYYTSRGTAYIDANLTVQGYDSNDKVGNRYTGLFMPSGAVTYISGNASFANGNAVLINQNGGFVTGGDLTIGSTIWNYGKLHIFGGFTINSNHDYPTDNSDSKKNPEKGWSLKNGTDSDNGGNGASFLVYNNGEKGGLITFKGYVKNSGQIHMNYGLSVEGFCTQSGMKGDYAFVNFAGSKANFSGEFRCNSNRFMNRWNAKFGCDGRFTYAEIAFNCDQMYVGGDMIDGYDSSFSCRTASDYRDNAVGFLNAGGSDSRSFSLMNGAYKVNGDTTSNPDQHTWSTAMLFVGGNLQLGNYESEKKAGTALNVGTIYTRGYFKVYSFGGNEGINTGPAFYQTSIMAINGSNTFVGGECYSGSAMATGKNSIFMCDGDLRVRRPLKVNMWYRFYDAGGAAGNVLTYFEDHQYKGKGWLGSGDDGFRACYMRVGGSVYANVEGRDLENSWFTNVGGDLVPYDHSRDIDIQANANIMIGGGFYCPQKLYVKQNAKLIICDEDGKNLYDSNGNLNWKARGLDELASDADKNNPTVYGPGVTATLTNNVNNILDWISNKKPGEECALFAYMNLDMNICSTLVVHGNAFVRDTCKIRDMTRTYIYGDMIAKNYFELGKSLKDDEEDATQAHLAPYLEDGENDTDYVFAKAGYMYVAGNFQSTKYSKIYASTTLRVGGNMQAGDWTQILGNPYITLRHDARLFVGGNMRAYSSIDCGAYSELYVGGNCTAYTQNVKLRDQMTCYIGGDLTAATYIELGKYDENFYRGIKSTRVQQYLAAVGDNAVRPDNDGGDTIASEGGEYAYNGDEHEVGNKDNAAEAGGDNATESESSSSGDVNAVKDSTELENDESDLAVGSEYYIGGNIISMTKYIREYAYSRVVSGGYVLAVQHVTLRHNADMWVLPEVFGNTTYHTKVYTNDVDFQTSMWEWFKAEFVKIGNNIRQTFEPKQGSIYSLGQLTMNKNTSIFGTYDTMVFGQTVLRKGSLIYLGHDFDCWAPIYNLQSDFSSFDAFMNSMKANLGLSENSSYKGFDSYDSTQNSAAPKPIVIYANNEINVSTTARIRSTYFVANRGNVNFTNLNFASETSDVRATDDAKELPNAFASYQGDVNFYALRGSLGALMYAPVGNIDLDGFAYDFYGSMVGHTVDINTFYINVHRFTNWRTMDLHIATSKKVYLIPQEKYDDAKNDVDDLYLYGYDTNENPNLNEWARPFFPGLTSTSSETGGGDQSEGNDD